MIFRFGLIVFALFGAGLSCAYLYSQSALSDIEQRYPASGRFVNISGTQIHYTDNEAAIGGQGVPIVLLHGASTSLMDYEASIAPPYDKPIESSHSIGLDMAIASGLADPGLTRASKLTSWSDC